MRLLKRPFMRRCSPTLLSAPIARQIHRPTQEPLSHQQAEAVRGGAPGPGRAPHPARQSGAQSYGPEPREDRGGQADLPQR